MSKKRVFISFDYDNDRHYRYLLNALSKNSQSNIKFDDLTPEEIQSYDISRIKAVLTRKIREVSHTLVIVGAHANSFHPDRQKIGKRNWQWWEIEKSYEEGNKLIAVKIKPNFNSPEPIYGKGATWAKSFKVDSIISAINKA